MARLRITPAQAWRDFLYVGVALPLGIFWLIALGLGLALGVGLAVLTVGIPILAVTLLLWKAGANLERRRAALVLGRPIPRPAPRPVAPGRLAGWRSRIKDRMTWRELGFMFLLGLGWVGTSVGFVSVALYSAAVAALVAPLAAIWAPDGSTLGDAAPASLLLAPLAAVVLFAAAVLVTRGLAMLLGALAESMLAPQDRGELTARITSLEATRSAAVDSADARLRQIERDLHDGAQHRLAYIGMELGRARGKLKTDPDGADAILATAHEESKRAMRELRDLVRGIHPSVLTDRGLDAALSGLAHRASMPVEVRTHLAGRLPTAVETAAYYVVAEALTNAGKHAGAGAAVVSLERRNGTLVVEVSDDGRGGAARKPGSGLEGLAQRVEALDGSLAVESPPGGPTTVRAELPCGS
ncbi:MAG TPA: sensor domain-containing protein [Solirubrobacteraceae bacterium]|nr:sensor domain-containing protein [Solirubrobacteraceae bacterium]